MRHLNEFYTKIVARLDKGEGEYADNPAHKRGTAEFFAEIEEEMLDIAAWAYLGWAHMRGINVDESTGNRIDRELERSFMRAIAERVGNSDIQGELGTDEEEEEGSS